MLVIPRQELEKKNTQMLKSGRTGKPSGSNTGGKDSGVWNDLRQTSFFFFFKKQISFCILTPLSPLPPAASNLIM